MKGITIIIILSVVWSIVAGIIEKRKAAAKKAGVTPQSQRSFKADPVTVKVESLRRRQKTQQKVQPPQAVTQPPPTVIKKKSIQPIEVLIQPIEGLHKEDCPLPPTTEGSSTPAPAKQLAGMLRNQHNIRTAIVLSEILDKPISQRQ